MTPQAERTPTPPDASDATKAAWDWLVSQKEQLGLPNFAIHTVEDFMHLAEQNPTTPAERSLIVDQAMLIFDHVYAHMPFKTDIYHFIHPSEFLRQNVVPFIDSLSEVDFHDFMVAAFSLVRDAHTLYAKPAPFLGAVAFLPFQMRPYLSQDAQVHYIVSAVMTVFQHPTFGPGAEILMWGPEPIDNHVRRAAGRLPGGTNAAMRTRGAIHCTVRPLAYVQMPFPDELPKSVIQYVPASGGDPQTVELPWAVGTGFDTHTGFPGSAYSISMLSATSAASGLLLHDTTKYISTLKSVFHDPKADSQLPGVFQFTYTGSSNSVGTVTPADLISKLRPDGRFGYLRIASFGDSGSGVGVADKIVNEFQRILTVMEEVAPDGVVIDIRSNSGGDVHAAERMLQMLTPQPITPQQFHLANTPAILQILANINDAIAAKKTIPKGPKAPRTPIEDKKLTDATLELGAWLPDASKPPMPDGGRLTSGQPVTRVGLANDTGQVYYGPTVLLADGLTYSAADIFAAGYQDHNIGSIYGADETTGGGGATVWAHDDLLNKIGPDPGLPVQPLPREASMTVAIRRNSRVGFFEGQPVEDIGVKVNLVLPPSSVEDVLQGYRSIVRLVSDSLGTMASYRFQPGKFQLLKGGGVQIAVQNQQEKITSFQFYLNHKLALTADSNLGTYAIPAVDGVPSPVAMRIEAYRADGRLAAVRNLSLETPAAPSDPEDEESQ